MDGSKALEWPQVKVCGLTRPDQAAACVELGVAAIGLVFHPASSRNLSPDQALAVSQAVSPPAWVVGVMVDQEYDFIIDIAKHCRLDAVQLHGRESPALVQRLEKSGLPVIKSLFAARRPCLSQAPEYTGCHGLLAECGRGKLAGGNAEAWDWSAAASLQSVAPLVLAGGLSPENVRQAVAAALPDAVDASSALEAAAGIKDLARVAEFIRMVRSCAPLYRQAGRFPITVFGSRARQ